jgi:hypothetical protein
VPERLVEGAAFGVGREAEGAGDGCGGWPCRGRHAGRRCSAAAVRFVSSGGGSAVVRGFAREGKRSEATTEEGGREEEAWARSRSQEKKMSKS